MSEVLESLFGSKSRARLLRFFLLNTGEEYQLSEVAKRNMLKNPEARREINSLKKIKFINERVKNRQKLYRVNVDFSFYPELRNLVVKSNTYPQCGSLGRIKGVGNVKLAIISGIFLNYPKSKADMILVVDNVNRSKLKKLMNSLEAEVGKEISYFLMSSEELKYRLNMTDRFLLEFLRGPHDEIVNKVTGLRNLVLALRNE